MWTPSYGCNVGSCSWLQGCSFCSLPKSLCFPLLLQKKSFNLNFSAEFGTGHFGVLLYCRQALGRSESRWELPALPWWHGCNLCSFCIVLFCSTAAAAEFLCSVTLCDEPRLAVSQKGSYRVGSLLPLILVLLKELGVINIIYRCGRRCFSVQYTGVSVHKMETEKSCHSRTLPTICDLEICVKLCLEEKY